MSAQQALRARRDVLVARAAAQREDSARGVGALERTFGGVDRTLTRLRHLKWLPPVLGVGLGLVVLMAPRSSRVSRWIRGAISAWHVARSGLSLVAGRRP